MASPSAGLSGNQKEQRKLTCRRALITGLTLWGLVLAGAAQCAAQSFTSFDVPGSTLTFAQSINDDGAITGHWISSGFTHGFLRDPDGTITSFGPPDSTGTAPQSINSSGAITGYYFGPSGGHGFLRDPDGTITCLDAPGPIGTFPLSINDSGAITGYVFLNGNHGFVFQ